MKTINLTVSTVSARIYRHRTSNCSEIAIGRMLICVLTDSVLQFPLGVCLYWYGWGSCWACRFTFIGTVLITVKVRKYVYIDFKRIGIATGCISLPYCYCMIIDTEHICIFFDCTRIEIITGHMSYIHWDRVNIATRRMCMFPNFSGIETATGCLSLYF